MHLSLNICNKFMRNTYDPICLACHRQPRRPWAAPLPIAIDTVQFVDRVDNRFRADTGPGRLLHLGHAHQGKIRQLRFLAGNICRGLRPAKYDAQISHNIAPKISRNGNVRLCSKYSEDDFKSIKQHQAAMNDVKSSVLQVPKSLLFTKTSEKLLI